MAISTDFLRQLEKFNLVIRKKVASSFVGERRADVTGSGLIFRDYSNYSYGDDFKNIDWRAYAKSEKLYVKRYEEDRNLTIHILLDLSGSMDIGNKIKLIQVLDSMEKKMDIEGDYNLIDLETDGRMHTFVDSFLKKQYFNKLEMHNASIIDACGSVKADFFSVSSDGGIFDVFY